MQKVVGSNPIIRSKEKPRSGGVFCLRELADWTPPCGTLVAAADADLGDVLALAGRAEEAAAAIRRGPRALRAQGEPRDGRADATRGNSP
jgi:hypothetical protein